MSSLFFSIIKIVTESVVADNSVIVIDHIEIGVEQYGDNTCLYDSVENH